MYMDTDALRWLQQVADGTTLTEVSELEAVTQSGVSRALARLESQLGTPLLRRRKRRAANRPWVSRGAPWKHREAAQKPHSTPPTKTDVARQMGGAAVREAKA